MKVAEEWKELRPQIGGFICRLDQLYKGAEDIDEAIYKAEVRGYEKGFREDKKHMCLDCKEGTFYKSCNGYISSIKCFTALSDNSKSAVIKIIEQLYKAEQEQK